MRIRLYDWFDEKCSYDIDSINVPVWLKDMILQAIYEDASNNNYFIKNNPGIKDFYIKNIHYMSYNELYINFNINKFPESIICDIVKDEIESIINVSDPEIIIDGKLGSGFLLKIFIKNSFKE